MRDAECEAKLHDGASEGTGSVKTYTHKKNCTFAAIVGMAFSRAG